MPQNDDGGPAFPLCHVIEPDSNDIYRGNRTGPNERRIYMMPGMSLRDWFAGQALMGLVTNSTSVGSAHLFAGTAYKVADAMLAERAKKGGSDE